MEGKKGRSPSLSTKGEKTVSLLFRESQGNSEISRRVGVATTTPFHREKRRIGKGKEATLNPLFLNMERKGGRRKKKKMGGGGGGGGEKGASSPLHPKKEGRRGRRNPFFLFSFT